MSVLDQSYRRWQGDPVPHLLRVLTIPRYALADLFRRKAILLVLAISVLPSVFLTAWVYVTANAEALKQLIPALDIPLDLLPGAQTFARVFGTQALFSIGLVLFAAPRLFTPDLAGGALPLYFSKSVRRADYIGGKCSVLFVLVSGATWVPLLLVAGLRMALATQDQLLGGVSLGGSIVAAGLTLALLLTAIGSAVAVHVRRAWQVPFLLLVILGAGKQVSVVLRATTGWSGFEALSPLDLLEQVRNWAFGIESMTPWRSLPHLSVTGSLVAIAAWILVCAGVLFRRIRPVEVVR
jgi:ABC-2 type transport system permease protein